VKIVLAPIGTRGDVQPLIAVGVALRARGHAVVVCAPENYGAWVGGLGLEFRRGGGDFDRLLRDGSELYLVGGLATDLPLQFDALREAAAGADVIVGAAFQLAGPSIAAALGVRYVYTAYTPSWFRSRDHAPPGSPLPSPMRLFNRLGWAIQGLVFNRLLRDALNRERLRLGLAPVDDTYAYLAYSGETLLLADPLLSPVPDDVDGVQALGLCFLDEPGELDDALERFLDEGEPPLYAGFGSMRLPAAEERARVGVAAAVRRIVTRSSEIE
jgi:vancomycin aglycone glucosyltransferase